MTAKKGYLNKEITSNGTLPFPFVIYLSVYRLFFSFSSICHFIVYLSVYRQLYVFDTFLHFWTLSLLQAIIKLRIGYKWCIVEQVKLEHMSWNQECVPTWDGAKSRLKLLSWFQLKDINRREEIQVYHLFRSLLKIFLITPKIRIFLYSAAYFFLVILLQSFLFIPLCSINIECETIVCFLTIFI